MVKASKITSIFAPNKLNIAAALVLPIALGGCISVLPKPGKPPVIAQLRGGDIPINSQKAPFTISIGVPIMARAIGGDRVAVVTENSAIAYVDGLLLSATAPISIQNVILETFDKSQAFKAVARGGTNSRADFELLFDVSRFDVTEPRSRRDGVASINITARLIDTQTRRPLAIRQFSANAGAKRGSVTEPALALEAATQKVSQDILNWTLETGSLVNQPIAARPAK